MQNKTYSLALGGGAARGFAHIGVLKYLEENNIEINEISGTSMGAIIGAMFAVGFSIDKITKIVHEVKVYKLVDFNLRVGVVDGKNILKKLEEVFGDRLIENCEIDLKIVATDFDIGEKYIFTKGKITQALRASCSLPSIIAPHKIGNKQYVDGGITCNLPIEVLEGKNIIAVSALKDLTGKIKTKSKFLGFDIPNSFFTINYHIMHKTVVTMMRQNEKRSLETPDKNIIYLLPDFTGLDYYSFDKINEMIKVGYDEANRRI